MALPFGISSLCTLLLWGCICFPPQKGYNIAHGYSISDGEFSNHAGMFGPQTSNLFHSGASLNTNQDPDSPGDEMQAMRHQSFVSLQREPAHHENNEDASSVNGLSEEMAQSTPDSEHDVPSAPPVHESSAYQHPFGLLLKEHTQEKTTEGVSFPTITDFKRFIETMKSSFLRPGSDLNTHFQTTQDIMKTEMASNAENINGEPDTSYMFNAAKEGKNEAWSEPMNTVFEQQGTNYQMPSESLSVPDPVDSTASLISASVYDNQHSSLGSALYPHHHLAATDHVSSNYGSFDSAGISGENPDIFTSATHVRNEGDQSQSYKLPEQIPSGSFFGDDSFFSGHVTASFVNPPNGPPQDFSDYSSKTSSVTPLTSEKNIQQPKYTSHSKDSSAGHQKPAGGFELGKDFQSEELGRVTPANVLSAPMPPSLNSYANSVHVSAPRGQLYIPPYQPKRRERPAPSFQAYQPTVSKETKDMNYPPTAHLPISINSVSSSSDDPSPQSSSGHVGVHTSSPHDAQNQAFNRKQPVKFHQVFTVKPPSSFHGYLGEQTVSVSRPSIITAQAKDEEKSDLSRQNLVSATQGPKQMAHNNLIPISSGLDSTQSWISSQVGVGDANFNFLTNLAPTSPSERAFSRLLGSEIMSRKFGIKNIISGARNPLSSFSTPIRQAISLSGGHVSTPLSASKVSASTLRGVFWGNRGNTKRLPPKTGPNMSLPAVNTYVVKSRNGYVRGKVSLSHTRYSPYQLDEYKNTVSRNVKGSEEQ